MPATYDHSDLKNGERLREYFGSDLKYVEEWDEWIVWDGRRWVRSRTAALAMAKETSRRMLGATASRLRDAEEMPADESSPETLKRLQREFQWAAESQSAVRIRAMLDLARAEKALCVGVKELDQKGDFLNVANGTVDLRTGRLDKHSKAHLSTRLTAISHNDSATAPRWATFLSDSMGGDVELISYLQRLVGYSLTGSIQEHLLVFFYGEGANGKSTFLNTIQRLLGEYAGPAVRNLLFRKRNDEHPTGLADLHGKRFVVCSEIEDGKIFDEALVKDLTGGEPINARRMRQDPWSFDPTHKLFIAGNHKPVVRGDDHGIWRRLRLVPWEVRVTEPNRRLGEELLEELPGILNWAIEGCLAWRRDGLVEPEAVREATRGYRAESDLVGAFLKDKVAFVREGARPAVLRADIRAAYEEFCREMGAEPLGARRFSERLRKEGASDTTLKDSRGIVSNAWRGIRWLTEAERLEAATRREPN